MSALIITHYQRMLDYMAPTQVHVMMEGRIVKSGGPELGDRIERDGFDWIRTETGSGAEAKA